MLAFKYILFALFATVVNLGSQFITFEVIEQASWFAFLRDYSLLIGILVGTSTGLLAKYVLDKKYIFHYQPTSTNEDAKTFLMYSTVGLFTTVLFWLVEVAFDYYFESSYARYIGAVIGLAIGYTIKYFLDKSFVFKQA